MQFIKELKSFWREQKISAPLPIEGEINAFESKYCVKLPADLAEYFRLLNGTNNKYDEEFFAFTSLKDFQPINDDLRYFTGIPDYSNIVNTLPDCQNYYVFSDYMFHLFSYAIRLDGKSDNNLVVAICGDKYQQIATSFTEFIEVYLKNCDNLLI